MKVSFAVVVVAALAALGMVASTAEAAPDRVAIGSVKVAVGEQGTVDVRASDVAPFAVVDWVVNVGYDQGLAALANLDLPECERTGAQCTGTNKGTGSDSLIELRGISPGGMPSEATLATIVFRCERAGISELTIDVETWGAELGVDLPPLPEVESGSLECVDAPTTTPAPATTATPAPSLPPTGAGPSNGGSARQWAIAILSGTGAALLGIWALRRGRV